MLRSWLSSVAPFQCGPNTTEPGLPFHRHRGLCPGPALSWPCSVTVPHTTVCLFRWSTTIEEHNVCGRDVVRPGYKGMWKQPWAWSNNQQYVRQRSAPRTRTYIYAPYLMHGCIESMFSNYYYYFFILFLLLKHRFLVCLSD